MMQIRLEPAALRSRVKHSTILIVSICTFVWENPLEYKGLKEVFVFSKTCVKRPLKNRQNKDLDDKW